MTASAALRLLPLLLLLAPSLILGDYHAAPDPPAPKSDYSEKADYKSGYNAAKPEYKTNYGGNDDKDDDDEKVNFKSVDPKVGGYDKGYQETKKETKEVKTEVRSGLGDPVINEDPSGVLTKKQKSEDKYTYKKGFIDDKGECMCKYPKKKSKKKKSSDNKDPGYKSTEYKKTEEVKVDYNHRSADPKPDPYTPSAPAPKSGYDAVQSGY